MRYKNARKIQKLESLEGTNRHYVVAYDTSLQEVYIDLQEDGEPLYYLDEDILTVCETKVSMPKRELIEKINFLL